MPGDTCLFETEQVLAKKWNHRKAYNIMGQLHDDIIYYYDQNPLGFSFLVQITAFVI